VFCKLLDKIFENKNSNSLNWKTWLFGMIAKNLNVLQGRDDESALGCFSAQIIHAATCPKRFPSGAVPENLASILSAPDRFLVKTRRDWDIHKISRLYAGECYPVGPTRELCFKNCWVHVPSGTVISCAKEVIAGSTVALGCFYQGHSQVDWNEAPWIEEDCFLMATCWGNNYAHWLFDSIPRLSAHVCPKTNPKLLLGKNPPAFQIQCLAMLGWQKENLITPDIELVRCRRLTVHMASEVSGVPHPECIRNIRKRLLEVASQKNSGVGKRRIYISRQKTRRRIVNHSEIEPFLREFGFEEIFCEEISFEDQVRMFSEAEAIFGPHGAGTINAMFAPEGAALIEAYNPQVWDHAAHRVASICGVKHFHLFAQNASPSFDISINPRTLKRTLALALCDPTQPRPELIEERF
jgi:capsular polysaccharide biosynthesis protein